MAQSAISRKATDALRTLLEQRLRVQHKRKQSLTISCNKNNNNFEKLAIMGDNDTIYDKYCKENDEIWEKDKQIKVRIAKTLSYYF